MSVQDRRVVEGVQGAIAAGVDAIRAVLPEPVAMGVDLVRGQVERALGKWTLGLLDSLVATGVVTITAGPGASVHVTIRD